uniref:Uncharacterized protein n=1 Tax=Arundo donax TaxID=35708 RepID=A0A0A9C9Q1_ARUDO
MVQGSGEERQYQASGKLIQTSKLGPI